MAYKFKITEQTKEEPLINSTRTLVCGRDGADGFLLKRRLAIQQRDSNTCGSQREVPVESQLTNKNVRELW